MADNNNQQNSTRTTLIATILTALISGGTAIKVAQVNSQSQKSTSSYEQVADRINKLEEHAKKQDEFDQNLLGQFQSLNSILQFALASQSGKRYIRIPHADIPTYSEFKHTRDRPPIRTLVDKKEKIASPETAAAIAVEGLKNLQADVDSKPKEQIKIEPLPPKL